MVNRCWAIFRGVLTLTVVLVAALGTFLYFRIDDEAQRLCEAALNRHCAPFVARVGSASFTTDRGVTMRDVEIIEPLAWRSPRGVLQVDELLVEGRFDIATLLRGKPIITRVVAKSPRLAATRRRDKSWNLADFKPPAGGGPTPLVEVQDATILLANETGSAGGTLAVHHLDASFGPSIDQPGRLAFTITARDTLAHSLEVVGDAAADGSGARLAYKAAGVQVSRELFSKLARLGFSETFPPPVKGLVSLEGDIGFGAGQPLDWRTTFEVADGECLLPGVKRPLREVALTGDANASGLRVTSGRARWGDARLALAGTRNGWRRDAPVALRARLQDFDLASTPVAMLPSEPLRLWRRFKPLGRADIAADLAFDGVRWSPRVTIDARGASFEDGEKFPYRLLNANGQILVNGGVSDRPIEPDAAARMTIDANLRGDAEGAPVQITAALRDIPIGRRLGRPRAAMPLGWVEVSGNGVPISSRLIEAVPQQGARDFITALRPSGAIDVRWRAERNSPADPSIEVALDMRLVDCRLQYERFPYPLSGVTGWVQQRGKRWEFYELRSRDARGRTVVSGVGSLDPEEAGCRFDLTLTGEATPLDQTLFDAMPAEAQQAWTLLRPRGQVDFVAKITRGCGEPAPSVRLAMTPHQRTLAIEPPLSESGYRYRLEQLGGEFEWADDRLTMKNARANHGRTSYSADGSWESLPNGAWRLVLQGLNADRLDFSRDFMLAAPAGLRGVVEELKPQGGFGLFDSRLEVTQAAGPAGVVSAEWWMGIDCHQASLDPGVPLEAVSGSVRLHGKGDGATAYTEGELKLDSLFWNDFQLTSLSGPLWADGEECLLGEGAARKMQGARPRAIEAQAYGGAVKLNSRVRHGGQSRYGLAIGLAGIDVTRLSAEWLQRPETLDGSLNGQLELQGVGSSIYGLTGKGALAVSDADLYELPLFLSLLKYLRNRPADNTAFNRLETKFTLEGEDILFENFDLLGDAVSLYGKGKATLQRDVDLTFASIVGRNEFTVPILKSFVSSASEQLLRLRVVGPADAPEVRREVLPMVGNVFEQLQADFGGRVTSQPRPAGAPTRR